MMAREATRCEICQQLFLPEHSRKFFLQNLCTAHSHQCSCCRCRCFVAAVASPNVDVVADANALLLLLLSMMMLLMMLMRECCEWRSCLCD